LIVQKRLSHQFSAVANYTYSHCISDVDAQLFLAAQLQNPNNAAGDRGSCGQDLRHVLNSTLVLTSPTFSSRALQRFAGGWQLSSIFSVRSGVPFTVSNPVDIARVGSTGQRANIIGNPNLDNPTANAWFNTAAFASAAEGQFGNLGRNTLRGSGY